MKKGSHSVNAHLRIHILRLVMAAVFDQYSPCNEYLFGVCWEMGEREFRPLKLFATSMQTIGVTKLLDADYGIDAK